MTPSKKEYKSSKNTKNTQFSYIFFRYLQILFLVTVPDSEIRYKWSGDNPFQFNQALSLPDFEFDQNDIKLSTCHKKYESGTYSQSCPKHYDSEFAILLRLPYVYVLRISRNFRKNTIKHNSTHSPTITFCDDFTNKKFSKKRLKTQLNIPGLLHFFDIFL